MNAAAQSAAQSAPSFDDIFEFARDVSEVAKRLLSTPPISDAYIKPEELSLPDGDGLVRRAFCIRSMSFYAEEAQRQPGAKKDLLNSLSRAYRIRHAAESGVIKTAATWRYAITPDVVLVQAENRTRTDMQHAISTDLAARNVAAVEIANLLTAMAMKIDIGTVGAAKVEAWRKTWARPTVAPGAAANP